VGFGIGLRERPDAAIVYLTDSAPRDPHFFTTPAPSREVYGAARRAEAEQAAKLMGVPLPSLRFLDAPDMESYQDLARLERELRSLAERLDPQVLWSPAYDGGHPDHDVAAFLTARLAAYVGVPHCEFALYSFHERFELFRFAAGDAGFERRLDDGQQVFKRQLMDVYVSQEPMLRRVASNRERYRQAPRYDFSRRPAARTVYEAWGWPLTADALIEAFTSLGPARLR
jgi:LmbE family N-acetylglucosaminyl deacetylase